VRLWGVAEVFADAPYAQIVTEEVKQTVAGYTSPFVGASAGLDAVQWLQTPAQAASVALLPLRLSKEAVPFGLLVLASPDAQRFHGGMGTNFLEHLAELCSAAFSALLPARG
jgi:uncharacterized protein YigA (DUF484 family)